MVGLDMIMLTFYTFIVIKLSEGEDITT